MSLYKLVQFCTSLYNQTSFTRVSCDLGGYVVFTDRRPNPNAAQCGSLTSGLSFPSFRYRSGWNSSGLLKALRSFNIDLGQIRNSEQKIGLSSRTNHALAIRIVPFGI